MSACLLIVPFSMSLSNQDPPVPRIKSFHEKNWIPFWRSTKTCEFSLSNPNVYVVSTPERINGRDVTDADSSSVMGFDGTAFFRVVLAASSNTFQIISVEISSERRSTKLERGIYII